MQSILQNHHDNLQKDILDTSKHMFLFSDFYYISQF